MLHKLAPIFLIDQTRNEKSASMFAERFFVRAERFHNLGQGDAAARSDEEENLYPVMVRHSFEVPLHLFCGFSRFRSFHTITIIPYPYILKFVRVCARAVIHLCEKKYQEEKRTEKEREPAKSPEHRSHRFGSLIS